MRSGIILLLVILILPGVVAAPQIDGISGTTNNGATIGIIGSGFGSHTKDVESVVGPNSFIETAPLNSEFVYNQPFVADNSWRGVYSASFTPKIQTNNPRPGSSRSIFAKVECNGATNGCNSGMDYEHPTGFKELYATWYVYFDPINYGDPTTPNYIPQWKMWRVHDYFGVDDDAHGPYAFSRWSENGPASYGMYTYCGINCVNDNICTYETQGEPWYYPRFGFPTATNPGVGTQFLAFYNAINDLPQNQYDWQATGAVGVDETVPTPREWARIELWIKDSDPGVANGELQYWITKDSGSRRWVNGIKNVTFNHIDGDSSGNTACYRTQSTPWNADWKHFAFQNFWDANIDNDERANFYFDDIYLQFGTKARVELCDSPNWNSVTHCEIQTPIDWNNGNIQIEINYGSFQEGQTAYLYVIEETGPQGTPNSQGYPIILGSSSTSDSLLLYSSMTDANAVWQPEVSQNNFATMSQAIPGSGMISYQPSMYGSAAIFNGVGPDNGGPLIFKRENFDLDDKEQDGGRVDFLIRFDENPNAITGNKWIARTSWDPTRHFNVEYTGTSMFLDVYSEIDSTHRTNYNKFRAMPGSYSPFRAMTQGNWYWWTFTWRNNGAFRDEVYFYINGEQQGCISCSDFGADLPIWEGGDWLFSPNLYGDYIAFGIDEVYSFNSWDVSGVTGDFPTLNIPNQIRQAYPGSGEWPTAVTELSPTFEFIPIHDTLNTLNCQVSVDGSSIGSVTTTNNEYTVMQYPGILSVGTHYWTVNCDGGLAAGPMNFVINPWKTPLKASGSRGIYDNPGDGRSVIINADAAWLISGRLNQAEVDTYFANRKAQGFNAVLMDPLMAPGYFGTTANAYGEQPFTNMNPVSWTSPNEAYWQHVDYIINKAEENGFLVLLTPAYLGYNCGDEGWCPYLGSNADMQTYGAWLATRYSNKDIIWVHGGDTGASTYGVMDKVDSIAAGINSVDNPSSYNNPNGLHTAHCLRQSGARECYDRPWLQIDNVYADCNTVARETRDAYLRSGNNMPIFFFEGRYEGSGSTGIGIDDGSAQCARGQAYLSMLGGATSGHIYGSEWWGFFNGWESNMFNLEGGQDMKYYKELFQNRQWWDLEPDYSHSIMTSGYGDINTGNYAGSALMTSGFSYIAYIPTARTVTIDLTQINGDNVYAYWFNPRTGTSELIGMYQTINSQSFTSPDSNDWILVIDSTDLQYLPPGSFTSSGGTCSDGMQNQGETGIDCGGPCAACTVQETCTDGILNQDEVHTDCGGSTCAACECYEPSSTSCTTTAGCTGEQICVDGTYDSCVDSDPNDGCPAIGDNLILQNGQDITGYGVYDGQRDNCVVKDTPNSNWNNGPSAYTECQLVTGQWASSNQIQKLISFDTSFIDSSKNVLSATLELYDIYPYKSGDVTVELYPLTKSFDFQDVTWECTDDNNLDGLCDGTLWDGGEPDVGLLVDEQLISNANINVWYSFDVTNLIQEWVSTPSSNHGFLLKNREYGAQTKFSDYDNGINTLRPKLTITLAASNCSYGGFDFVAPCGTVDLLDLLEVIPSFRSRLNDGSGRYNPDYDFNGDNNINILDLTIHVLNFGTV